MPRTVTTTYLGLSLALSLALVGCTSSDEAAPSEGGGDGVTVFSGPTEVPAEDAGVDAVAPPGDPGMIWTEITAATDGAMGHGYVVEAPLRLTLPATDVLAVGEEIELVGRGAPYEVVLRGADDVFGYAYGLVSEDWADRSIGTPSTAYNWNGVAADATGEKVAGIGYGDRISTSALAGCGLGPPSTEVGDNYTSIASDDTGRYLVVTVAGWAVWTSGDAGATWTRNVITTPNTFPQWTGASMSADGAQILVGDPGETLYLGTRGAQGYTFAPLPAAGRHDWRATASDATGQTLVAAAYNGAVYVSSDRGVSWTEQTYIGESTWRSATISADASRIFLATGEWGLYAGMKSDGEWAWEHIDSDWTIVGKNLGAVALSRDGSTIFGAGLDGVYRGHYEEHRWTFEDIGGSSGARAGRYWTSVATNTTGSILFAVAGYGDAWSYSTTRRRLAVSTGGSVRLVYSGNGKFYVTNATGTLSLQ